MNILPVEVYSVAAVRELDRLAIEDHGIAGYTLMTRAGEAAVKAARGRFADANRWQVVCGAGNNAGDGYVVARLAAAAGLSVSVIALVDPQVLGGDAATAYADFVAAGGTCSPWSGTLDADVDLIVDALLGSGLMRDVDGEFAACVEAVNQHPAAVLALDIPTGLNGDDGAIMGCAVHADLTVTFVGMKTGVFLGRGPDCCGEIAFDGLDIPAACYGKVTPQLRRVRQSEVGEALPRRSRTAHKGRFGHVLVVGGGAGMPGAVRLCGEAALRTGAGLVSVATHPEHAASVAASRPELMPHAIHAVSDLESLLERADVVALGPGLGRSDWADGISARLQQDERPAVWDADALNWLATGSGNARENRIITPHPGEAARLLGVETSAIQADRGKAVLELQSAYGGVAVLKGARSLTAGGSGAPWLCTAGNPGMAAAGMGDVLTGIVAALIAQGLDLEDAARIGVQVHARAGDLAAVDGERGMLASDLFATLRSVVN
jgi:NAD(P)H-hydrate epimerase